MADDTKTNDEAMHKDLVQYLEKTYPKPHDWALDMSIFFKALAMKHLDCVATVKDRTSGFESLIEILKELSIDRGSNISMGKVTRYAQDVKASVFNFETNSAYILCITEDPLTSAVSSLTLDGKGPATITVSVQKKDGAGASVKDSSDGDSEG